VKVRAVEILAVTMALVAPFRTAFGTQAKREVLLVRVTTDAGVGWGECAAHCEPFYNSEFAEASQLVITRWLAPAVLRLDQLDPIDIPRAFAHVRGFPAAKAAVEMAVLDAHLRGKNCSMAEFLGGSARRVPVGVSVGIAESVAALVEQVAGYVNEGYTRVKIKIKPGWDVEPVRAIRRTFPELALQVDANCSYAGADTAPLRVLDSLDLQMIEQPLASDDLEGHGELASCLETPICLDESICTLRDAAAALKLGACSIINIKVGRVGGLLTAQSIHGHCYERAVPVWCGGMLESGIGRAANLALASLPGFVLPADISASRRYFSRDITPPFELGDDSCLDVPHGAGLGVDPDPGLLVSRARVVSAAHA
jgi:O-succinylbenzoate synthase